MKAITVATSASGYFETLKESALLNNYELHVLGFGMPWKGFGWRLNTILDYLKTLPDNEIVIVIDAYDVIFLRDSTELEKEFLDLNAKFLCGAFRKLDGIFGIVQEQEFGKTKHDLEPPYNNICAGTYISRVKTILDIYEKYTIKDDEDDQILLNKIYDIEGENIITPDTGFRIFCTLFPCFINRKIRNEDEIVFYDNKLKSEVTNTFPFVLHGLANTDLYDISKNLGYKNLTNKTTITYIFKKVIYHLKLIIHLTVGKYFNL